MSIKELKHDLALSRTLMWIAFVLVLASLGTIVIICLRQRRILRERDRLNTEVREARERSVTATPDFLRLARVNESMEQIDSICREKKIPDNIKLENILRQLDNVSLLENSWEVFRHNFEGVHSGFFRILKERHPSLTTGELRMCAYVVMQLSSKEIANLTGRTIRSVESMRYRIHKKLEISGKDSLADYLLTITG